MSLFHYFLWTAFVRFRAAAGVMASVALFLTPALPVCPVAAAELPPITVTNLLQLQSLADSVRSHVCALRIEATVCAASGPDVGAVVVADQTGVKLLHLGKGRPKLQSGDKIMIQEDPCMVRGRATGLEISSVPVVDDDGLHSALTASGSIWLAAGYHRLQVDWFNAILASDLELSYEGPDMPSREIPNSALWHRNDHGGTSYLPGLEVECFEGSWENVPDFNWLEVVKSGCVTNLGTDFASQSESVGLRFSGFFQVPKDGQYTFHLTSDDGALLFLGDVRPQIRVLGRVIPPPTSSVSAGQPMAEADEWVAVEGRVTFMARAGRGWKFELRTSTGPLSVEVADADGLDPAKFLHARTRVRGMGQAVLTLDNRLVLGRVTAAGADDLEVMDTAPGGDAPTNILTTAEQVQRLNSEAASHLLLVRLRGVVTSALQRYYRGLSLQDDTRGIFVDLHGIREDVSPASGEIWEVTGHTVPGDFAPVVSAENLKYLGAGQLPEPADPSWNQLINGSMDAQWVEVQGVVTEVSSNRLNLLLPEGVLRTEIDGQNEAALKPLLDNHVRIRGVLFAEWNPQTHEVIPAQIILRNASVNVDHPALTDVFDAALKTVPELLRFDIQAVAFQRVRVRGQVIYADAQQVFLMDGKYGLRVLPVESYRLRPGDLAEAVGYPEISGLTPVLREAVLRASGHQPLPSIPYLAETNILAADYDSTLMRLTGTLLSWHPEGGALVLEMQSGRYLFVARLALPGRMAASLRAGSRLAITGVYVAQIHGRQPDRKVDGFELLLNSPADIQVLSMPSWWTLTRLLGLVGVLVLGLMLATLWITLLRRQVEQRTRLLRREIREREEAERARALEAERARIARDLHDDLGSSLTEIGVLASRGIRQQPAEEKTLGLFRSITDKARGLIAALDEIVWAVDPADNSLQSLADYLSGYAAEYLASAGISCRFKIPITLPGATLEGRVRHDLFLAIKETLHNIVQHARATEVEFHLTCEASLLEILIVDNGCGFVSLAGEGHGLKYLPARLAQLGGRCQVVSTPDKGTRVQIQISLPQTMPAGKSA